VIQDRLSVRAAAVVVVSILGLTALCASSAEVSGPPTKPAAAAPRSTPTAGSQVAAARATPQRRPNIVFVLTDDLSMNLLPYLPAVQQLQRRGTTLSHYYVVDSLCCPSRTAIFTGEYPHNNGVFTNTGADGGYAAYNAHGDQQKSFAIALQQAGYRTGFLGKYLNGYSASDPQPPGWDTWGAVGNGYREFGYDLNDNGRVVHYGNQPADYLTDVLSQKAGQFVRGAAKSTKPFLLEVSTFAPHSPYTPAPRYAAAYPHLTYPRTPAFGRLPSDPPGWLARRPVVTHKDALTVDDVFRQRVRSVLAVDDLLTNLQKSLRDNGVARDTYVVFSSDNGLHTGEYRLMPGKQTAFDPDIHVPLVVTGPGVPAGRVAGQLASNIDLAPTFETLAGARIPRTVDGVSLAGLWHGARPVNWQQAVLIEHHHPIRSAADPDQQGQGSGAPPSYEAIRTLSGLYVRYADGSQEYYETALDPYELNNLAGATVPPTLVTTLQALQACHGTAQCQTAARLP
jgi:N-acetylglucosamine-6-sulfatase